MRRHASPWCLQTSTAPAGPGADLKLHPGLTALHPQALRAEHRFLLLGYTQQPCCRSRGELEVATVPHAPAPWVSPVPVRGPRPASHPLLVLPPERPPLAVRQRGCLAHPAAHLALPTEWCRHRLLGLSLVLSRSPAAAACLAFLGLVYLGGGSLQTELSAQSPASAAEGSSGAEVPVCCCPRGHPHRCLPPHSRSHWPHLDRRRSWC